MSWLKDSPQCIEEPQLASVHPAEADLDALEGPQYIHSLQGLRCRNALSVHYQMQTGAGNA